jgi:hypothetical protein
MYILHLHRVGGYSSKNCGLVGGGEGLQATSKQVEQVEQTHKMHFPLSSKGMRAPVHKTEPLHVRLVPLQAFWVNTAFSPIAAAATKKPESLNMIARNAAAYECRAFETAAAAPSTTAPSATTKRPASRPSSGYFGVTIRRYPNFFSASFIRSFSLRHTTRETAKPYASNARMGTLGFVIDIFVCTKSFSNLYYCVICVRLWQPLGEQQQTTVNCDNP